jgi:hypothetical protein
MVIPRTKDLFIPRVPPFALRLNQSDRSRLPKHHPAGAIGMGRVPEPTLTARALTGGAALLVRQVRRRRGGEMRTKRFSIA